MHLSNIDLNLLVAFDELVRRRSVTLAGRALGLSQPAMSRTLGRLRDLFEDPLLTRAGQEMVPTARALELAEPVRRSLDAVRHALEPPGEFDPETSERDFVVSAVDTTLTVVLPRLLDSLSSRAPGINVTTTPLRSSAEVLGQIASGERDLAIGRFEALPAGFRHERLLSDRIVCLARRDHPRIRDALTLEAYLGELHIAPEATSAVERPFTIESLLARQGLSRRVACTMENLAMAPFVVSRTDLLCTAPRETILPFAAGLELRTLEPPFETPSFDLGVIWHERAEGDRGHRWFCELLQSLFAGAPESTG